MHISRQKGKTGIFRKAGCAVESTPAETDGGAKQEGSVQTCLHAPAVEQ